MRKIEVRLLLTKNEIRLKLVRDGQIIDAEVFVRESSEGSLKEIAQVSFDDLYDLVNYANGSNQ